MDSDLYVRFVLSLTAVLGMIFGVLWLVRRRLPGAITRRGGAGRRLAVVESLAVDVKHRLILVRRDDREHLLLVGGTAPLVVEADCPRAAFTVPSILSDKPETGV
jgi:flagellar protein FliO/FliZ